MYRAKDKIKTFATLIRDDAEYFIAPVLSRPRLLALLHRRDDRLHVALVVFQLLVRLAELLARDEQLLGVAAHKLRFKGRTV